MQTPTPKTLGEPSYLVISAANIHFYTLTHHNFQGQGASDSQLDVLLNTGPSDLSESLNSPICSLDNPLVQSYHDIIISSFPVPKCVIQPSSGNIKAPRIPNTRVKIKWKEENRAAYESLVSPSLSSLRERWTGSSGPAATSILLTATNDALSLAAQSTNSFTDLGKPCKVRSSVHPEIKEAQKASLAATQSL